MIKETKPLSNELTNVEKYYINICIPKKAMYRIVEFKGKSYGQLSDQALESLKLLWITDSYLETILGERFSVDILYLEGL